MAIDTDTLRPTVITRAAARAAGLVWFYTGKECHRGHLAMRYVSTGNCCTCMGRRPPGQADTRKVPRVFSGRYVKSATPAQRKAWGEYLRVCLDAFEAQHGPTAVLEKV